MKKKNNGQEAKDNILIAKLRNKYRILNHMDLMFKKINSYKHKKLINKIGVIEFHPSDVCDLNCFCCTYRWAVKSKSKEGKIFPSSSLSKILELDPKAMVIVGGGEPVLYKEGNKTFKDLVSYFVRNKPEMRIGLATNGATIPKGDWMKHISWVRISMDAANENTFIMLKDGNYNKRMQNILEYLKSPIKYVGVGFLYSRFNFDEVSDVIKNICDYVSYNFSDQYPQKLNIQFRPTCPIESCECPSPFYKDNQLLVTPDLEPWWGKKVKEVKMKLSELKKDKKMEYFIDNNTNVSDFLVKNKKRKPPCFHKCYTSLIRWIIRPNGDVYPCVMKASNRGAKIGNILKDSLDTLSANAFRFYNLEIGYCNGPDECCRFAGGLNKIVEKNLYKTKYKLTSDPFF